MTVITEVSCWVEVMGNRVPRHLNKQLLIVLALAFLQVFGIIIKLSNHGCMKHLKKAVPKDKTKLKDTTPRKLQNSKGYSSMLNF